MKVSRCEEKAIYEVYERVEKILGEVKHTTGCRYVLCLLKNKRKKFPYFYLENNDEITNYQIIKEVNEFELVESISIYFINVPIEMCDQRTIDEVKKRLKIINTILDSGDIENPEMLSKLALEREQLINYLNEVLTASGKIKRFHDQLCKSKFAVKKSIQRFMNELFEKDSDLATYIERHTVKDKYTISFRD